MSSRDLDVRGRTVQLYEAGNGKPVLYLHDVGIEPTTSGL